MPSRSLLSRACHDSVTRVPSPAGENDHDHSAQPSAVPPASHANLAPASAAVTSLRVSYSASRPLLVPVNQAPTAGLAPSSHRPPVHAGLHSPMRAMSVIIPYSFSAGASTT